MLDACYLYTKWHPSRLRTSFTFNNIIFIDERKINEIERLSNHHAEAFFPKSITAPSIKQGIEEYYIVSKFEGFNKIASTLVAVDIEQPASIHVDEYNANEIQRLYSNHAEVAFPNGSIAAPSIEQGMQYHYISSKFEGFYKTVSTRIVIDIEQNASVSTDEHNVHASQRISNDRTDEPSSNQGITAPSVSMQRSID